jgi:oligoendopeptidase F
LTQDQNGVLISAQVRDPYRIAIEELRRDMARAEAEHVLQQVEQQLSHELELKRVRVEFARAETESYTKLQQQFAEIQKDEELRVGEASRLQQQQPEEARKDVGKLRGTVAEAVAGLDEPS